MSETVSCDCSCWQLFDEHDSMAEFFGQNTSLIQLYLQRLLEPAGDMAMVDVKRNSTRNM